MRIESSFQLHKDDTIPPALRQRERHTVGIPDNVFIPDIFSNTHICHSLYPISFIHQSRHVFSPDRPKRGGGYGCSPPHHAGNLSLHPPTRKLRRAKRGELYEIPPSSASRAPTKTKLCDWWIGGLEDLICLPQRTQRAQRVIRGIALYRACSGLESQIHQSSNHPILQWRLTYRTRQKNGEIILRLRCGRILGLLRYQGISAPIMRIRFGLILTAYRRHRKRRKGRLLSRPFRPLPLIRGSGLPNVTCKVQAPLQDVPFYILHFTFYTLPARWWAFCTHRYLFILSLFVPFDFYN